MKPATGLISKAANKKLIRVGILGS